MAMQTQVCDFGRKAVDFDLPGTDGKRHRSLPFAARRASS